MKWAMTGLAALAVSHAELAYADPADSDLWIGFEDSKNGFLIDEDTGALWMTGECLKSVAKAERSDDVWTSHTVELVSVGRSLALLDQTFELTIDDVSPLISVESAGRGGKQSFPAMIDRECVAAGMCARLIQTQMPCAG